MGPLYRLLPLALAVAGMIAAQTQTEPKCMGGTLIRVQPDSITVQLNRKVMAIRVTPETEIWRRGVDLASTAKLVLGEQIYPTCNRLAADGLPIATVVAEAEGEDAMDLEPHHIQEIRSCGGSLIAATRDTVTARDDDGKARILHVTPETVVWRGEIYRDTTPLGHGDEITARCVVHYPDEVLLAEEIWANATATEGVIVKVLADSLVVDQYPGGDRHSAYPRGHVTVVIDGRTHFEDGVRADLQPGRHIRAIGLELSRSKFRASGITVYPK